METVNATTLKHRLGGILDRATLGKIAIERHGRIVAYLVPAPSKRAIPRRTGKTKPAPRTLGRREEERLIELCASGDFRPSRWLRAGDRELLAGLAVMLASTGLFDRMQLLALAERLKPGMSTVPEFGRWLETSPVKAARFVPMLRARLRTRAMGVA